MTSTSVSRPAHRLLGVCLLAAGLPFGLCTSGCGSASATTTTTTTTTITSTGYDAVYKATNWGSNVTATFPTACTMTLKTTGVPAYHADYYLGPATSTYTTIVATTPNGGLKLAVIPYSATGLAASSATYNICPSRAATTTSTNMGSIGTMISGVGLFNAYEATGTVAVSDNVTYTFKDSGGNMQTASFLDDCNAHSTGAMAGGTWHYHALPPCVTALVDTATGPSHLIGIALDGFPIYGGRDINGNVIDVSKLDACNGITSATPEFPDGTKYHYVLPIGVTTKQSSISCYSGSVTVTQVAKAERQKCDMKNMKSMKGM